MVRLLAVWLVLYGAAAAVAAASGAISAWTMLWMPVVGLTVPVNPQGRGDFYLAPAEN